MIKIVVLTLFSWPSISGIGSAKTLSSIFCVVQILISFTKPETMDDIVLAVGPLKGHL